MKENTCKQYEMSQVYTIAMNEFQVSVAFQSTDYLLLESLDEALMIPQSE